MDDSSNRSNLEAKSSDFQAKIRSHTRLYFTVSLIKNTECIQVKLVACKEKKQISYKRGTTVQNLYLFLNRSAQFFFIF